MELARNLLERFMRRFDPRGGANGADLGALAEALLSTSGEASGTELAARLLAGYQALPRRERAAFLQLLAQRFGPDPQRLSQAMAAYRADPGPLAAQQLHAAAEPRRQELLRRINMAREGTLGLVRMREDLLPLLKGAADLAAVDADFVHLFASWFNRGFLALERIDWSTSAEVLERIIRYEAVHAISSWDDLRRRIEPADRRCFAFFHPALADEPLIFIEVALAAEIPAAIAPLLAADRVPLPLARATTAVFYSISNCQPGLRGVSFGHFLIKQVVEELRREAPGIRTFVTLSPVPGLARWIAAMRANGRLRLADEERRALAALDRPDWHAQPSAELRSALVRLAHQYLLDAKDGAGKPLDPVARFHLGNGARLERIHWMGDASAKGLADGAGFMVNYLYDLGQTERNHEAYAARGEVAAAARVRATPQRRTLLA